MPEVVHIHTADCNAAHSLGLLCQFFHAVAGGIVAHVQIDAVRQTGERCIFGIHPHDGFVRVQALAGGSRIGEGKIFAAAVQRGQGAVVRIGSPAADHECGFVLDLIGKIHE